MSDPVGGGFVEADTAEMVYDIQVVLRCRKTVDGETFTISIPWTPILFYDVDTCS